MKARILKKIGNAILFFLKKEIKKILEFFNLKPRY